MAWYEGPASGCRPLPPAVGAGMVEGGAAPARPAARGGPAKETLMSRLEWIEYTALALLTVALLAIGGPPALGAVAGAVLAVGLLRLARPRRD